MEDPFSMIEPQSTVSRGNPFSADCDWEAEHGMFVVYHPALGVECTCFDGLHDYTLLLDEGPSDSR